jgi:hypothetical protein
MATRVEKTILILGQIKAESPEHTFAVEKMVTFIRDHCWVVKILYSLGLLPFQSSFQLPVSHYEWFVYASAPVFEKLLTAEVEKSQAREAKQQTDQVEANRKRD